jgi:microcystin-dependent protein
MSVEAYVGEIRMFGGNFAPYGWAMCSGQHVPIDQNEALYALIGTTYGGDGQTWFALPNLQSRVPMHQDSSGHLIGQTAGLEGVTLTGQQIPIHMHLVKTADGGAANSPAGAYPGISTGGTNAMVYDSTPTGVALSGRSISTSGGSQPHSNIQPYLAITFIICLYGIFPPRS